MLKKKTLINRRSPVGPIREREREGEGVEEWMRRRRVQFCAGRITSPSRAGAGGIGIWTNVNTRAAWHSHRISEVARVLK